MSIPTPDQRTPVLRLKFESDDTRNYNWWKLDDVWGSAFTPGSPIQFPPQRVWVGTPTTLLVGLTPTPVELANVVTDSTEDPLAWSLVLAQVTLRIQWGASGSAPGGIVTLAILRGTTTTVQQRTFTYDASQAPGDGLDIDLPYTLVHVGKPGDATAIWRVTGTHALTSGGAAPLDIVRTFAQVYCLQVR